MENHIIGTDPYSIANITNTITNSTSNIVLLRSWKEFGRHLSINDADIYELEIRTFRGEIQLQCISHELLTQWKANQGNKATLRWLCDALNNTGVNDIADQLTSQWVSSLDNLLPAKLRDKVLPREDPEYYVTRTVSYRSKLDDKIFSDKSTKDHIFLIKGVTMHELGKIAGPGEQTDTSENQVLRKDNHISSRFILLELERDYEKLLAKAKQPVHQVKKINEEYFWVKSSKVDQIRKFLFKDTTLIPEEDLTSTLDKIPRPRVISIEDSPGMGKTFLLNKLANKIKAQNPSTTTLFVILQEFAQKLECSVKTPEAALKALAVYITVDQNSANTLRALKDKEKLYDLFFDGYDEVEQSDIRKVNGFLSAIRKMQNVNTYVTTRPHLSNKLAQVISSRSYEILPFDENKQVEFLTKYWENKHKAELGPNLVKFAKACLSALQVTMTDNEKDIAGIPLQCMMLAEVYAEEAVRASECGANIEFKPKVHSIFDMYKRLVEQKFERIAKYEKVVESNLPKFKNLRKMYYQHHIYEAVKVLFPEWLARLENLLIKRADTEVKEDLIYSIGLIEKSPFRTLPRFIHRTFAEYMLAEFLVKSLTNSKDIMELVFNEILGRVTEENKDQRDGPIYYKFAYPNMAYFINHHVQQRQEFQIISTEIIFLCLKPKEPTEEYNENKYKALTACASSNLEDCFDLVVKAFIDLSDTSSMTILSKYLQHLPHVTIHHSKSLSMLKKVEKLMQATLKTSIMEFCAYEPCLPKSKDLMDDKFSIKSIDLYKYPWISQCTPLHVAAFHGCYDIVKYLLLQYGEHTIGKYFLHVCIRDSAENSPSVVNDKLSIIDLLLEQNENWLHEKFDQSECTPLLQKNAHLKILEKLVARGADINYSSNHYGNVLLRSMPKELCHYNDIMSWAFTSGYIDTDLKYCQSYFPFVYNIVKKYKILTSSTLDVLAKAGLDINAEKVDGTTLLFYLLQRKLCTPDIISELIRSGANINHVNKEGKNAMHIYASVAANELHSPKLALEIAKLLATNCPKLKVGLDSFSTTKLLKYLSGSRFDGGSMNMLLLEVFHEIGADFNAKTKNGDSALLLTLQRGCHIDVIERVMNYGAEVNHKNKSNQSAAHQLFMYPHQKWHVTPLDIKLVLELLLSRGYTLLNEPDNDGNTSLHLALRTKLFNKEVLDIYSKKSANFNAVNNEGDSIILTAITYDQSASVVEKLVDCGSDIYKTNSDCQNALHIAAKYGNGSVVKMLINKFDVNCLDKDGNTPLHLVNPWSTEISDKLVSVLLSNGANFFATNTNGQVPLERWIKSIVSWSRLNPMFSTLVKSKHLLVSNDNGASICLTILLKYCIRDLGYWVRAFDIQHYRDFANFLVDEGGQFLLPNEDHLTWLKLKDEHRLRLNDVTLTSTNIEQLKIRMILHQDFPTNAMTLSQLLQLSPNIPVPEVYRTLLNDELKSFSECVKLTEIISSPFRLW